MSQYVFGYVKRSKDFDILFSIVIKNYHNWGFFMDFVGSSLKIFEYCFLLGLKYNRILPQLFSTDPTGTCIPSSGQKFRYKTLRLLDLKEIVRAGLELYVTSVPTQKRLH